MRKRGAALLAAGAILLAGGALAAGSLSYTTDYATYGIRGTTPAQVLRELNLQQSPDDALGYASTTQRHEVAIDTVAQGSQCKVSRLSYVWHFVITTPQAVAESTMSAGTRGLWRNFVAAVQKHEERHRTIFIDCGEDFVAAAARMTGPQCGPLETEIGTFLDAQYDACMEKQRAFDAKDAPRLLTLPFMKAALAGD